MKIPTSASGSALTRSASMKEKKAKYELSVAKHNAGLSVSSAQDTV